ncbi:MAG: response regulator [Clostridia bacterium]|nr:response regulator [Clostridia bacterium]
MRIQSWPIDLYFLYAVSGLITVIVSAILFNRVWHTKRKSQIDKDYCYLLVFFAVFGLVDAVWGFLGSPVASPVPNPDAYNVFTYFFHTMAGLSAFVWTVYIIRYLKLKGRIRVIALVVCVLFLMTQAALIIQNMFTGNAFGVAADGSYHINKLRPVMFFMQFAYYVFVVVLSLIVGIPAYIRKDKKKIKLASSSILMSAVMLVAGFAQMFYPDGPFYSIGFMVAAVTIYSFNVTRQREKFIYDLYESENSKLSSIVNNIGQDFRAIYYVDLETMAYENFGGGGDSSLNKEIKDNQTSNFFDDAQNVISKYVQESDKAAMSEAFKKENLLKELEEKGIFTIEYKMGRHVQRYYMIKCKKTEADGKEKLLVGVYDIDDQVKERMKVQEELKKAMDEALYANKAKTSFLFNMSHDIRTPMNAIIGFTDMAKKYIDDKERVEASLSKVSMASEHLLSLINDVLDMARIESGKVTIEEKPVSITASADNLYSLMASTAEKKNINFTIKTSVEHDMVFADALRVGRVYMNILSNAIKYTGEGGMVAMRVTELPSSSPDKVRIQFSVADNGIGMSEEFQEHLFDAFSREQSSTVSGIQGTGLGMAITKELVGLMKGTIDVSSKLGEGTVMTVTFPFRNAEGESLVENNEFAVDPGFMKGKKLLLVEDNELNREIAVDILSELNLDIDTAEDGTVAIKKVAASIENGTEYDVILMDIQMPIMDGYTATGEIRELQKGGKRTPIIAMTANAFDEDKQRALASGMDGHVAKPINVKLLVETLAKFIPGEGNK